MYHQAGIDCLFKVIPVDNILFASAMVGPVRGIDPRTQHHFDDTRRYIDRIEWLSDADRAKVYEGNVKKVFPRFKLG